MIGLESHRKKPLKVHLQGVFHNATQRGFGNEILEIVCFFHDIAKCNPHFQNKLYGKITGYSQHSYLSAYITTYLMVATDVFDKKIDAKRAATDLVLHNILQNIIVSHHGNLRNIDSLYKEEPLNEMIKFLNDATSPLNFEAFVKENFAPHSIVNFSRSFVEPLINPTVNIVDLWKNDSLDHFFSTLFNFSQLIEADKRDAGENKEYPLMDLPRENAILDNNLNKLLTNLKVDTELNKVRTQIREDAVKKLATFLVEEPNVRVFTSTSPTGSGKTFMSLKLANVIQQMKGDYGIIMAIPFTSIIDQTAQICNETLLLNSLNYTSVASTSQQMEKLQKKLEDNPESKEAMKQLIDFNFSEETFNHSFVVTTFVQLFETLISNKNATLIKLPNFTKRIFLIDEYQSLPANLYTFFCALLQEFCIRYDSYAILTTATMPEISFNEKRSQTLGIRAEDVFKNFTKPKELSDYKAFYKSPVFDRYTIRNIGKLQISGLLDVVNSEMESTLVILNTVKDALTLFDLLPDSSEKYLLNKNFTITSRLRIIDEVKEKLKKGERIILISTQLIEAGVDVDFPIVYRDVAPLPSLIQSAGRCNRNGQMLQRGQVKLFTLMDEDRFGKERKRASLVYRQHPYEFEFVDRKITFVSEKDLLPIQEEYFRNLSSWKEAGRVRDGVSLLEYVYTGQFEELGSYRLIEEMENEKTYFVGEDSLWKIFKAAYEARPDKVKDFNMMKVYRSNLRNIRKRIAKHCVSVIIKPNKEELAFSEEIMEIRNLKNKSLYSEFRGLNIINKK